MKPHPLLMAALLLASATAVQSELQADFQKGPLPLDPAAGAWSGAAPVAIPLLPQQMLKPHGGGSVKEVSLRALHNGTHIALRADWRDTTRDTTALLDHGRDAVALMFPLQEGASPIMGNPNGTVNIWQWRADWQEELDSGRRAAYPEYADFYRDDNRTGFARVGQVPFHGTPVDDLNAEGPGTLTRQKSQDVDARGTHTGEGWTVVFLRRLDTQDPNDALLKPGSRTTINVAVWNGSDGDVGARKSVSLSWTPLRLEPAPAGYRPPAPEAAAPTPRVPLDPMLAAFALIGALVLVTLWREKPPS